MRIHSGNQGVYSRLVSTRPAASTKRSRNAVFGIRTETQSSNQDFVSKTSTVVKDRFNAGVAQKRRDTQQTRVDVNVATSDYSANGEGLCIGASYIQYEKVDSIYDISYTELRSRLHEAVSDSSFMDTDGMTKAEIYERVQAIFTHYLGKDFLEPAIVYDGALNTLDLAQDMFIYQSVYDGFDAALHGLGITDANDVAEAKGFNGLNETDMRAAVRSKYPKNMTLKDSLLMADELGKLGLETTAYNRAVVEHIFGALGTNSVNPNTAAFALRAKQIFDAMLDMPAEFESMKQAIDAYKLPDGSGGFLFTIYKRTTKTDVLKDLLAWFGGGNLYGTDMAYQMMAMLDNPRPFRG